MNNNQFPAIATMENYIFNIMIFIEIIFFPKDKMLHDYINATYF